MAPDATLEALLARVEAIAAVARRSSSSWSPPRRSRRPGPRPSVYVDLDARASRPTCGSRSAAALRWAGRPPVTTASGRSQSSWG
jgi:hypothetical protein